MSRSKKVALWVIFFGPQNMGGPNKYYDRNGKVTGTRTEAAYFYTFEDAKEFADKMKIELSAIVYIGQEDFTQSETERIQANLNRGFS